ncbi:MAG TPA: PQQ-dependent dehydrogenase, methanol/ethanol family [Candidatus Limnocylindrales bacterium]|nr:PQQ-dependent dehydrogenase, methanol/ethanol family [Candidatus Limnocylindrales bacterium]
MRRSVLAPVLAVAGGLALASIAGAQGIPGAVGHSDGSTAPAVEGASGQANSSHSAIAPAGATGTPASLAFGMSGVRGPISAPSAAAQAAFARTATIDDAALVAAGSDAGDWITHGRTYSEQRYTPLDEINDGNVAKLKPVWSFSTGLPRGHEATPLAVDGVLFFTGSWSVVFAVDARNGALLWRYDPKVPGETGPKACCDVVNRGVAIYEGKVFVGALDGRLIALDAKTGKLLWEKVTVDQTRPYTITGAPRIVKGKVIIGNGGAELGVRGYISAYDPNNGTMLWRTFTVPGNPEEKFESKALEAAAPTWKGGKWWEVGGGGTAWDSMAFDPDLDLLYVGTGNGSPWVRYLRSPGGGDNLYLSCILALKPDTGEIVWHYQTTPGDTWDFTATQHMILADLKIGGEIRKVIMQAPKNGFFYVVDRTSGKLISAEKYVEATWAEKVDLATGRPIEVKGQDFKDELAFVKPTPFGGHNWQPMSFSPKTGLVYIPAQEITAVYRRRSDFEYHPGNWNTGTDFNVFSLLTPDLVSGHLLAWDPVRQKEVWRHPYAVPWNGGTLATGGNLVFQGTADGRFLAFNASTGKELWEGRTGTGVGAGPISYQIDGKQYVTVVAGWGGAFALAGGAAAPANNESVGRVITWSLPVDSAPLTAKAVVDMIDKDGELAAGERLYHRNCADCHGSAAVSSVKAIPDLRFTPLPYEAFDAVVRQGLKVSNGMPNLSRWVTANDTALIKKWLESIRDKSPAR